MTCFPLHMRRVVLVAALALTCHTVAHATRFTSVNTFGDSLSDSGHFSGFPGMQPRFTTNPDRTWTEHLADAVGPAAGPTGTNHAVGGARTTLQDGYPDPFLAYLITPVASQINAHLARVERMDGNGLYAVWTGANDVINAIATHQGLLLDPSTQRAGAMQVVADLTSTARDAAALVGKLDQAGAATLLVMNLPDLGQTPAARAVGTQEIMSLASRQFNAALRDGLADSKGNLIMLDAYEMMHEIMDTPARFGLDNVTSPACLTESAQQCTRDTLVDARASERFLFADALHPTGAGHRMLSDYAASVIRAPGQMGRLAEAPLPGMTIAARHVANRLRVRPAHSQGLYVQVDHNTLRAAQVSRFEPGMRTRINALTLGADHRINDRVLVGATVTHAQHRSTATNGAGSFDLGQTLLTGYGQYRAGAWSASLAATAGVLDYNKIMRHYAIGSANLSERGKTDGMQYGLRAAASYDWTWRQITISPTASLSAYRTNVNQFTEKRGVRRATSLQYLRQTRASLVSSIGVDVTGEWQVAATTLNPFARLAYEHDHHAGSRHVRAKVQGMAGSFATPLRQVPRHTALLTLGMQGQIARATHVDLAYHARFASREQTHGMTLGLNVGFRSAGDQPR